MVKINAFDWAGLPQEMRAAVLEKLDMHDVRACSLSDRQTHVDCLPILFRMVKLPSLESLLAFLSVVPETYHTYIHHLAICTKSPTNDRYDLDDFTPTNPPEVSRTLAAFLSRCTTLESLSISVGGSLVPSLIIPAFQRLQRLRKLELENWEQEEVRPFSERLAVSIAFSLPLLDDLALTRITRSALHARELEFSTVPIVKGDDIAPHAILGSELRLPQLLRLPHLRKLKIRDTHLGDPLWVSQDAPACPLQVLDLGSCAYVSPQENAAHTEQILSRVPRSVEAMSLSSSLSTKADSAEVTVQPSLERLRTLHLTTLVPTSSLTSTLTQPALASSPVQSLSCAFHPDDAAEGCAALEAFLKERHTNSHSQKGRKRSGSKLAICENFDEAIVHSISADEGEKKVVMKEVKVEEMHAISNGALSPLYPSLRTLSIDIPAASIPASPMGKLSPRRLAAARRREEERRDAARRLKTLAQDLGIDFHVNGVEGLDFESEVYSSFLPPVPSVTKAGLRSRSNSA